MNALAPVSVVVLPAVVRAVGDQACRRFLEFFASTIRNPHTRRAYGRAVADFLACGSLRNGVRGYPGDTRFGSKGCDVLVSI